MDDLRGFGQGIAQGGDKWGGGAQGRWGGDNPRRSKSWLTADGFGRKAGSGLESSMISRRIVEIRVLSAYSQEVILINPPRFLN